MATVGVVDIDKVRSQLSPEKLLSAATGKGQSSSEWRQQTRGLVTTKTFVTVPAPTAQEQHR